MYLVSSATNTYMHLCYALCNVVVPITMKHVLLYTSMQVDLTEPILSRFDILCVVRDLVDPVEVRGLCT